MTLVRCYYSGKLHRLNDECEDISVYTEQDLKDAIEDGNYTWQWENWWDTSNGWTKRETPLIVSRDNIGEDVSLGDFKDALEMAKDGVTITDLGVARLVSDYGGEGQGDAYWFVVKVTPILSAEDQSDVDKGRAFEPESRYFKVDGYYASYDGGYYDTLYEVKPKKVVVTQFEEI